MDPIINEYANDDKWMFPYLDYNLHTNCNFSQLCNETRRQHLPLVLNHQTHLSTSRDNLLKYYYDQHLSLKWLACVADVSMPTSINHYTGSILLNHLLENKNTLFQTLFIEPRQIDYHVWLQTSRIKFWGLSSNLKIAVGDIIVGESMINKYYKKSDGQIHYGLGKTIINNCGIPAVKFPPANAIAIDFPEVKIINYDRYSDYIVGLSYPDYYRRILNRYKHINIQTLQYIKGYIHTDFRKSNYVNYHTRLNENDQLKIKSILENQ